MTFVADQELIDYWNIETSALNEKVDDAFREAQNHAYEHGYRKGLKKAAEIAETHQSQELEDGCGTGRFIARTLRDFAESV